MNELTQDMVKVNSVDGMSLITEFWAVQWGDNDRKKGP